MAPVELDLAEPMPKRQRDGIFGVGSSEEDKRRNGNDNSNPNSNGGNNGGNNKSDDSGKDGEGQERDHPPDSPFLPPSTFVAAKSTSVAQTTSTATTVVATSTTAAPSSSTSSSSSVPIASTTTASFSSSFPTTTSILASITPFPSIVETSSQPRRGLNTDGDDSTATATRTKTKNTQSTAATAFADTAPSSTSSSQGLSEKENHHDDDKGHGGLSPTAEHLLIAFGSIGALIFLIAAVYFLTRMKKIDLFSKALGREFSRRGPRGWYGWHRKENDYAMEEPPKYTVYNGSFEYASEQKPFPTQHQLNAIVSQTSMPPVGNPEFAAAASRSNLQRQDTGQESLLDNPAPFGISPAHLVQQSATQAFYNQNPTYDPSSTYSQTYNPNEAAGGLSRQTSDAYDSAQREVNHMSYLSSLSSGFGDQIIIPEPGPIKAGNAQHSRQSYRQSRKFSWATSARGPHGDRDTIYTEASIDSTPPRFRTINSWVAQQSGRLERQNQSNDEVPSMPAITKPLQVGAAAYHQRNLSEDPAFKHHPGDEIELSKGARIPSTILDKKFAVN